MEKKETKRGRPVQINFRVSEEESRLIEEKFALSKLQSKRLFILKSVLEGVIYVIDQQPIREHTQELNRIGVNFNQLVKRLKSVDDIDPAEIETIKAYMKAVFESENKFIRRIVKLR